MVYWGGFRQVGWVAIHEKEKMFPNKKKALLWSKRTNVVLEAKLKLTQVF